MGSKTAWVLAWGLCGALAQAAVPTAKLPAASPAIPYLNPKAQTVRVEAFQMDVYPVTNRQFAEFVRRYPQWQRGRADARQTDSATYLRHWAQAHAPAAADADKPVTNLSWFAANAYCRAQNKRLPLTAEWEYAAMASPTARNGTHQAAYRRVFNDWYAAGDKRVLRTVGRGQANIWGIHDLHGLIWEWTEDFNNALLIPDANGMRGGEFCGIPANAAVGTSNHGAFIRLNMRSRLQPHFAMPFLGFRCVAPVRRSA
ncbi:formylglycine-generating enzyme family protein [Conchiformibius steedae DSM 2580]|uniref:Formylglycine-generating enzyme family protein n=1 Tax=Conchiformibius steedae DSM 2580 TaxID=1121352 RepID=A0AAE9HVP5_9NEIS|nr:formylglycine-generating enzyme family protein [Conchiformibius steedae]QMT32780.1 formylglycine-generating enzyme family protein [Conchiformibius steedae]URD67391.1 formylglycine-generating enzyme family protein [Conchiformibius steedae DSM 2580]